MSDKLAFMSDEELDAAIAAKKRTADISSLSDEDLDRAIETKRGGANSVKEFFTGKNYDWTNLPGDLAQGQVDALPAYGGAVGSFISAGNPAVTGMLSAAGGSLKNGINGVRDLVTGERSLENEFRLPTGDEVAGVVNNTTKDFSEGAMAEMGGQVVAKGIGSAYQGTKAAGQYGVSKTKQGFQKAADMISPSKEKLNADEIIAAAKELGIDVTPGMLDDSGFVARLESSLAKSPSYFGQKLKRAQDAVYSKLNTAGQDLTGDATTLTPQELGNQFKSGVAANIGERLDPIAAVFDDVASHTKHVPIGEKSINAITRNIQGDDLFSLGVGSETAKKYVDAIPRLKNANQVKVLMTALNEDLKAASGSDRQVLNMIKDKLSRLESNSIVRSAIQTAKESGGAMRTATGEKTGKEIVADLLAARKGYAGLSSDVGEVAKDARIRAKNPNHFLSAVEDIPSEKIQGRFFDVNNNRQLMALKEKFPEQFELLKQGKLKDIFTGSKDNRLAGNGDFQSSRFLQEARNLNREAQELLFGSAGVGKIGKMQTVQNSLPPNFNPSGTASEQGWKDIIMTNAKDAVNYGFYKGAAANMKRAPVAEILMKSPQMQQVAQSNPAAFQALVFQMEKRMAPAPMALPRAADNQEDPREAKENPVDKKKIMEKAQGTKYGQVLQNAAEKGDKSFNAAHYVLSQRDPEYRKQQEE